MASQGRTYCRSEVLTRFVSPSVSAGDNRFSAPPSCLHPPPVTALAPAQPLLLPPQARVPGTRLSDAARCSLAPRGVVGEAEHGAFVVVEIGARCTRACGGGQLERYASSARTCSMSVTLGAFVLPAGADGSLPWRPIVHVSIPMAFLDARQTDSFVILAQLGRSRRAPAWRGHPQGRVARFACEA